MKHGTHTGITGPFFVLFSKKSNPTNIDFSSKYVLIAMYRLVKRKMYCVLVFGHPFVVNLLEFF